ncbi:hypothetical protein BUALT_Bualt10G0010800 [Buddleja alternifolia]|uniref:pyruvate decarboxylase n=1 Tax=Buddleja alternifolia TaxID=168488 RepID=A0AAV6WVY1_9LAMI|nr:hypothetical protein BUALT_Bualt10G0010800 [Buddleja alternifolia]
MIRCGKNCIIFLINNGGYTIEVEIHDGPYNVIKNWDYTYNGGYTIEVEIHDGPYNVIKNWDYTCLVDAIHNGQGKCWTSKVKTEDELVEAIAMSTGEHKESLECFELGLGHYQPNMVFRLGLDWFNREPVTTSVRLLPTNGLLKNRHKPVKTDRPGNLSGQVDCGSTVEMVVRSGVQPKQLEYSIEQASINGYILKPDGRLNADFHFVLRANNPKRRISLYYDRIRVMVSYEGQKLAVNNTFQPFYQPRRNVTQLEMELAARDAVVYGAATKDLGMEIGSGSVNLVVRMRVKMRLKVGPFKVHRKIKVDCGPMRVPIFSSSQGFQRVFCDVDA